MLKHCFSIYNTQYSRDSCLLYSRLGGFSLKLHICLYSVLQLRKGFLKPKSKKKSLNSAMDLKSVQPPFFHSLCLFLSIKLSFQKFNFYENGIRSENRTGTVLLQHYSNLHVTKENTYFAKTFRENGFSFFPNFRP